MRGKVMTTPRTIRWIILAVGLSVLVGVLLVGGLAWMLTYAVQRVDAAKRKMETSARMRWLAIAVQDYHAENKSFPDSLQDLKPLFGKGKGSKHLQFSYQILEDIGLTSFEQVLANPWTGESPGYEYVKPTQPVASTPIIYQLKNGQRVMDHLIGYYDGSIK
jgi:hypothetical protein